MLYLPSQLELDLPNTAQEAVRDSESRFWIKAMQEELNSFEENQVWSLVDLPKAAKVVGNKWVFKCKCNQDGSTLHRARLVAKGFTQTHGTDYHETFAPVVRRTTIRILFATAVNHDLKIHHWYIKTAFLHGDLSETVYMCQPEGFEMKGMENKVCRLHKAVYGLKQAARSWNLKADKFLKNLGFKNFPDEACVYIKENKNSVIIVALYVDDFYIFFNSNEEKCDLLKALQSQFKVKDLGTAKNCLGMIIDRNWSEGTLNLHQEDYIHTVLTKFKFENCKDESATPLQEGTKPGDLRGHTS